MVKLGASFIVFLGILGATGPVFGVSPSRMPHHYLYDAWQIEEGLPQNMVKRVLQTRDGYLWAATQEGLVQYDGLRFTVYDPSNTPAILDPDINDFVEDSTGRLWVATRDGLVVRENGRFRRIGREAGLPDLKVNSIILGAGDVIWLGTGKGLAVIREGKVSKLPFNDGELDIQALAVGPQGEIWVGSNRGLLRYANEAFTVVAAGEQRLGRGIQSILVDADGVWLGTQGRGLVRFVKGKWISYAKESKLRASRINHLYRDRHGTLWISTFQEGLVRYADGKFDRITVEDGLNTNRIECVYEDQEGSLWVGTGSGGLNRLRDGQFTTLTRKDGLPDEMVWAVFQSSDGGMWVGTEGGVSHIVKGKVRNYSVEQGLTDNVVNAVAEDKQGNVWVGTYSGITVFTPRLSRTIRSKQGLPAEDIRSLLPASEGMWIGIMGAGVVRYTNKVVESYNEDNGLPSNEVRALAVAADGSLWVGTNDGVSRITQGSITNFSAKDGFVASRVFSMAADGASNMWLGTDKGLFYYNSKTFIQISSRDGLFDEKVYTVLDDQAGRLWMSCNKGVFNLSIQDAKAFVRGEKKSVKSKSFGVANGMRSVECNVAGSNSGWRSKSGELWFSTIAGVAMINPSNDEISPPPTVVLAKLVVDGRQVSLEEGWKSPPGVDSLRFHYAAPTFVAPERIRFKYRLQGLSDEWVYADTLRVAQYAHLIPGKYVFEVKAIGGDSRESVEPARLSFDLRPYFYQTKLFYLFCAFAIISVALAIHRYLLRRHEKQEAYLEELVQKRTEELEVVNQRLKELSTRDPLTGLRNRRYLLEYIDGELAYSNRQHFSEKAGGAEEKNKDIVFVMVDIDHFKTINDTYGHAVGDRVLIQTAEILNVVCRQYDKVVRWGGEEFLLVAPRTSRESSHVLANRILAAFRAFKFDIDQDETTLELTCSVGFACYPLISSDEDMGWEDVVAVADEALYAAKKSGRDRWVGLLGSEKSNRKNLMHRLREGVPSMINEGELSVVCSDGAPEEVKWEL